MREEYIFTSQFDAISLFELAAQSSGAERRREYSLPAFYMGSQ